MFIIHLNEFHLSSDKRASMLLKKVANQDKNTTRLPHLS